MNTIYKTIPVKASITSNQVSVNNASLLNDVIANSAEIINRSEISYITDYEALINKPQINEVELIGNRSLEDIGINTISNLELELILR